MFTKNIIQDIIGKTVGTLQGKSMNRSTLAKVRVASMKERMNVEDFEVGYYATECMKSDGLTNPKTVKAHLKFQGDLRMTTKERVVSFGKVSFMGGRRV